MRTPLLFIVGTALAAVISLAGCSIDAPDAPDVSPSPSTIASPDPTELPTPAASDPAIHVTPESIEDRLDLLRGELAATSVGCDRWVGQTEGPAGAIGGTCNEVWTLFVFDTNESRNTVLALNQNTLEPGRFIVGPGWLIRSDEFTPSEALDSLGGELGYSVWEHTDPIPAT